MEKSKFVLQMYIRIWIYYNTMYWNFNKIISKYRYYFITVRFRVLLLSITYIKYMHFFFLEMGNTNFKYYYFNFF